jgi:L-alanine-DL-glutamate epimerase-like enolase superfamily enzyme
MISSQPEAAMTTHINTLNLSDVALVEPQNLALAMQHMVDTGRGLAMLRGITKAELREVDHALWDALGNDPIERLAVLVRFRCLIKVFGARRLRDLLMHTGHNLIAPAVQVAARMRFNADLGFNPVKFERALAELLAKGKATRRSAVTEMPLAA